MNTSFPDERSIPSCPDAFFVALRTKLAREVSGSAMLADMLEKVNRMQEVHACPAEFQGRFDEFIGRAEEYSTAIRPFFPERVRNRRVTSACACASVHWDTFATRRQDEAPVYGSVRATILAYTYGREVLGALNLGMIPIGPI